MLIQIENLTKTFDSRAALDDVNLTIDPGQIVAMLGPNGAGKTTLLRCLAGVSQAGRGRLLYDGDVFRRDRIDLRKRFHFVPDFPFVYPEATVLQHLTMILRAYLPEDAPIEEHVIELLDEFEILPLIDSIVSKLSRGQTYKVALTALMAVDPDVWILDEPFASGMDPHGIAAFRRRARSSTRRSCLNWPRPFPIESASSPRARCTPSTKWPTSAALLRPRTASSWKNSSTACVKRPSNHIPVSGQDFDSAITCLATFGGRLWSTS